MSIAIKHYGVYRFKNYAYPGRTSTDYLVLNAYGSSSLANGRNVMLYGSTASDTAQQWRAMYAGLYGSQKLYWLNCELGGQKAPFALDRYMGTPLQYNADVYKAVDSSAKDQLVYFTEESTTGRVYIRLFDGGRALTAAPNSRYENGNNAPSKNEDAGNVYWDTYSSGNKAQQWVVETAAVGEDPTAVNRATQFPTTYYYSSNNGSYPNYVGECTWYCRGRFHEINGVKNVGTGDAYQWATCALPSGVSRDTTNKTPRNNSVAVFGAGGGSPKGHVVFIESVTSTNVVYSDCNGYNSGGIVSYSNGEIEVRNSKIPKARDGYKTTAPKANFASAFGSGLTAIIYKP